MADAPSATHLPPRPAADQPAPEGMSVTLRFRVTEAEAAEARRRARAASATLSDYVRAKVLRGYRPTDARHLLSTAKSRHVASSGALAGTIAAMSALARQMSGQGNLLNQVAARLNSGDSADGGELRALVQGALEQHVAAQVLVRQAVADMSRRVPADDGDDDE